MTVVITLLKFHPLPCNNSSIIVLVDAQSCASFVPILPATSFFFDGNRKSERHLHDAHASRFCSIQDKSVYTPCFLPEMSVVPHGMFAARKVRENENKLKNETCDLTPTKYSSKYMNSIWGMYNRYSVHNFKKNIDEKVFAFNAQQQDVVGPKQSVEKNSTDFKGSLPSAKDFLPQRSFL